MRMDCSSTGPLVMLRKIESLPWKLSNAKQQSLDLSGGLRFPWSMIPKPACFRFEIVYAGAQLYLSKRSQKPTAFSYLRRQAYSPRPSCLKSERERQKQQRHKQPARSFRNSGSCKADSLRSAKRDWIRAMGCAYASSADELRTIRLKPFQTSQ